MKRTLTLTLIAAVALSAAAQTFTLNQCRGSRMPYPAPDSIELPADSLTPVMIYHVGRHGARYATSPERFLTLEGHLAAHEQLLSERGKRLLQVVRQVIDITADRWGDLDSLGRAEQRGIAYRLCMAFPQLVVGQSVTAISSPVGRCVESMNSFAGVLRRMQSGLGSVTTASGEQYSPLMRPFATDSAYVIWAKEKPYKPELDEYTRSISPAVQLVEQLMPGAEYGRKEAEELASAAYYVVSSLAAMGMDDADTAMQLLTPEEYNALWRIDNLRQYLSRTQTTISSLPAEIASPLLQNMVQEVDDFIAGRQDATLLLHFGHAETLMPLLSLMRLPGCYYLTHYFDTVCDHWQTFHIVPMAANLQLILLRSHSGQYYARLDLNERPILFQPWPRLRTRLLSLAD
ncbi:MAG: histidine phosphatase family protein [Bacteroides sp.]|nr:histidine phosphatase family protein [Bacteroides sp.]MCM1379098.1 histidine phosphatase family protein [Bacteroides sp.]MCM1445796.1 histidine phosphatase family protein [Prevotella sp.]